MIQRPTNHEMKVGTSSSAAMWRDESAKNLCDSKANKSCGKGSVHCKSILKKQSIISSRALHWLALNNLSCIYSIHTEEIPLKFHKKGVLN